MKQGQKKFFVIGLTVLIVAAVILSLYFVFNNGGKETSLQKGGREIQYYTCGMHPSVRVSSEEYQKGNVNCPICNMKLIPVYQEQKEKKEIEKKILFYRHPTDPSKTSVEPMKTADGKTYIPVYEEIGEDANYYGCGMEGEEHVFYIKGIEGMHCPICGMPLKKLSKKKADQLKGIAGRVEIKDKIARLAGVETEPAKKRMLFKKIRTVGKVAYDPMLAIAEDEYISALKASQKIGSAGYPEIKNRARSLVNSAEKKLRLLGLSESQINELRRTRQPHSSLILPEEKMWVYGDIYEYELSWVKPGQKVKITTDAVPGEVFDGEISSIIPVLDPKTRSARFRVEVSNFDLKLKPDMYVDIDVRTDYKGMEDKEVVSVPKSAVLETGLRKIVWVDKGGGTYEGREVVTGPAAGMVIDGKMAEFYPVLKGLSEGELVVTKANFLIDSQSQITGTAASAYGGALGDEKKEDDEEMSPAMQHQH